MVKRLNGNKIKIDTTNDSDLDAINQEYMEGAFDTWVTAASAAYDRISEHFTKYGAQRLNDGDWLKVIVEEEGEAVQAINKLQFEEAYKEMAQVIACWIRLWYEVKRMEKGLVADELHLYGRAK